jgi:hypothetical protein
MHSGLQSSATASSETARHCGLIICHIGRLDGKASVWGDHHNSSWVIWR